MSISRAELMALGHHPDWDDGRDGFLWGRFDAMIDIAGRIAAVSIIWNDNPDEANPGDDYLHYFDPQLEFSLPGYETVIIELTQWEAEHLILCPPHKIPQPDAEATDE